ADALKKTFMTHANDASPCSFESFAGVLGGKKIKVSAVEREEKSRLCGPAALNGIVVYDSGVYGLPKDTSKLKFDVKDIVEKGVHLKFGFIDAVSAGIAYEIEKQVLKGQTGGFVQVKMAKTPSDVNINVGNRARRFVESKNKPLSLKGPIFCAAEYNVV
ncbi:MAG: hypothetical protein KKD39_03385, partial [Candidatus Altiarchaeota archaeon]|nr:hypothetical protein [Candidatus Altiarchaeota archaeon]